MINETLEQQAYRISKEAVVILFGIMLLSLLLAILFTWLESKSKHSYRGLLIKDLYSCLWFKLLNVIQ